MFRGDRADPTARLAPAISGRHAGHSSASVTTPPKISPPTARVFPDPASTAHRALAADRGTPVEGDMPRGANAAGVWRQRLVLALLTALVATTVGWRNRTST
jgi:hypothetical protein